MSLVNLLISSAVVDIHLLFCLFYTKYLFLWYNLWWWKHAKIIWHIQLYHTNPAKGHLLKLMFSVRCMLQKNKAKTMNLFTAWGSSQLGSVILSLYDTKSKCDLTTYHYTRIYTHPDSSDQDAVAADAVAAEYPSSTLNGTRTCSSHSGTGQYETQIASQEEFECVWELSR